MHTRSTKEPTTTHNRNATRYGRIGCLALAGGAVLVSCVVLALGLTRALWPVTGPLRERMMGETPRAKIDAYMRTIQRGDREGALEAWAPGIPQQAHYAELAARRERVTDELLALGLREWTVFEPQWWTTCCEPHVTCSARSAGGARVQVQVVDAQGKPHSYLFDVFAHEQTYFGDAEGNPVRHWVVRDVYSWEEKPLFWPFIYETNVRSVP